MAARLILIHGRIQRHEDIIHVVSARLEDRSDWLALLSEAAQEMTVPVANADHVRNPHPGSARGPEQGSREPAPPGLHPRWAGHPRNERIIPPREARIVPPREARIVPPREARIVPKSRDFH